MFPVDTGIDVADQNSFAGIFCIVNGAVLHGSRADESGSNIVIGMTLPRFPNKRDKGRSGQLLHLSSADMSSHKIFADGIDLNSHASQRLGIGGPDNGLIESIAGGSNDRYSR